MITQDELKEKLHYDPITGIFTHLKTHRTVKAGDIAGHSDKTRNNYIKLSLGKGEFKLAHRVAFLYMWGYIPEGEVDHIDHDGTNNAWSNLRIVDHPTNGKNQKMYSTNSSGITGVRQRSSGKWRARIYHKGIHIDLGTFLTQAEAIDARKAGELLYNFHHNHGL